jgi:hypothetical protein
MQDETHFHQPFVEPLVASILQDLPDEPMEFRLNDLGGSQATLSGPRGRRRIENPLCFAMGQAA